MPLHSSALFVLLLFSALWLSVFASLLKLPRPNLLQRLVAQRSLLSPPREDIHTAPFLSAVRPLAFLCVMAQRLCVSAVKTKTPSFPYHSATHTVAKALRYGSASLRLRGGTEATAHVSASMNQDVSLRLGSAVKTKTPSFLY